MYKFSTKLFSIFLILVAFCSISCSNLIERESTDIDFTISGTELCAMMNKASARSGNDDPTVNDDDFEFVLNVILVVNGKQKETQSVSSSIAAAKNKSFAMKFDRIPVGTRVYLKVVLRTSQGAVVVSRTDTIRIAHKAKSVELKIKHINSYPSITTDIVLYSGTDVSRSFYQFEEMADAKISEGLTPVVSGASNSYTFDNQGNIYYIKAEEQSSGYNIWCEWYLYSKNLSNYKISPYIGYDNDSYQDESPQICCDWTDNSLYIFEDMKPCILKYTDISAIPEYGTERNHSVIKLKNSLPSDDYLNIKFFTVNEGIIYLLIPVNSFDYKIIKAEPVQDGADEYLYTINVLDTIQVKFSEIFGIATPKTTAEELTVVEDGVTTYETINVAIREPSVSVSDMQCIYGTIYLVANQVNVKYSESEIKGGFSRGALVQICDDGNEIQVCGFNNSTFNLSNYYLYAADTSNNYLYNSDLNGAQKVLFKNPSTFGNKDHTFHAALNNIRNVFVGPQKIVAIKPKKLVILDSGVAFYTDADNALSFKKINRLVEVDLLNFVLKDSNADIGNAYTPVTVDKVIIGKKNFKKTIFHDCGTYEYEDYSPLPIVNLVNEISINNKTPLQEDKVYKANGDLYTGTIRHVIFNAD